MSAGRFVCNNERCPHNGSVTQEMELDPSSEGVLGCELCGEEMERLSPRDENSPVG